MQLKRGDTNLEAFNKKLNDPVELENYKKQFDDYKISLIPKILGNILVASGNLVYGRAPSYAKFRAVEIIARVPYHSWSSAAFTMLTMFFANEKKAISLSSVAKYSEIAGDNETMHVVVISQIAARHKKMGILRKTMIPVLFSFFYFWFSYLMYIIKPKYSYELNYMFEQHAFDQYSLFLAQNEEKLRAKKMDSDFLSWYGRHTENEYDFFLSVRNDEIIHRNTTIQEINFV
jgi:hypothetical protein